MHIEDGQIFGSATVSETASPFAIYDRPPTNNEEHEDDANDQQQQFDSPPDSMPDYYPRQQWSTSQSIPDVQNQPPVTVAPTAPVVSKWYTSHFVFARITSLCCCSVLGFIAMILACKHSITHFQLAQKLESLFQFDDTKKPATLLLLLHVQPDNRKSSVFAGSGSSRPNIILLINRLQIELLRIYTHLAFVSIPRF